MDRKVIKQLRKALFFESLFTGVSSFSKILKETEDELEETFRYVEKKIKPLRSKDIKYSEKK